MLHRMAFYPTWTLYGPPPPCSLTQRSCRRGSQGAEGAPAPRPLRLVTDVASADEDHPR